MPSLAHQRCFHHGAREAVARCPSCGQFYCRECVTEHEDRLLCATCVKGAGNQPRAGGMAWISGTVQVVAGLLVAWLFFFWFGLALLSIESSFHDGTVWTGNWLARE
jgi:hypothetical protein